MRWADTQKRQLNCTTSDGAGISEFLPATLNERQRQCYVVVKAHFETGGDGMPLRMMVLGAAGSGKVWLVYAFSRLLDGFVRRTPPTGMAAFLISGCTLKSILNFPMRVGRNLRGVRFKAPQAKLRGVGYIVIYELYMASQAQVCGWTDDCARRR